MSKSSETRATNKKAEYMLTNKMLQNAFILRQSILSEISSDDTRNIDEECGYPTTLSIADYQKVYNRNGIGTRVVNLWPEECWSVLPKITEDEEAEDTEFEKALDEIEKEFQLNNVWYRLDVLSGIGRFGALLIGVTDGKKLNEPIDGVDLKTGKIKTPLKLKLAYIKPLSENALIVKKSVTDQTSPRFGQPEMYALSDIEIGDGLTSTEVGVHWTRVIHITDNKGVSDTYGVPRLQPVYNYVVDCKKLLGSSAEMFWKGGFPGIAFEVDKERTTKLTTDEKTALRSEFTDYSNHLQRFMALVGVTAKTLEVNIESPAEFFLVQLKAIGIALNVPYRKFLGTEESKLAGADDSKDLNRRITRRQNGHVTSSIVRATIDRFIGLGILPEPKNKTYEVTWPSLEELDPKIQAEIAKSITEAIAKYMTSGADTLIEPMSFLTKVLNFTDEEAEAIISETDSFVDDQIDEGKLQKVLEDDKLSDDDAQSKT